MGYIFSEREIYLAGELVDKLASKAEVEAEQAYSEESLITVYRRAMEPPALRKQEWMLKRKDGKLTYEISLEKVGQIIFGRWRSEGLDFKFEPFNEFEQKRAQRIIKNLKLAPRVQNLFQL